MSQVWGTQDYILQVIACKTRLLTTNPWQGTDFDFTIEQIFIHLLLCSIKTIIEYIFQRALHTH